VTPPTRVRQRILWLTVAGYMVTYMDRLVMSPAVPAIQKEFGFSLVTMGWILSSFRWGYALFQIPAGWLGDRIGPRRALALIAAWWSAFTSLQAVSWNAGSLAVFRFLFGVGQAGAFPIATRALSRWMLASERGYAQGITHAGSRVGGAVTPYVAVLIMTAAGWRATFLLFGAIALAWAALWYWYYRDTPAEHGAVNQAERELIGAPARATRGAPVPWRAILASANVWTLSAMYFCFGYCVAMYQDWFPKYLHDRRGFKLREMGFYASLPLAAGALGNLAGGWLSDLWAKRTGDLRNARRGVAVAGFLGGAAAILPATFTANPYTSVWYTCLALFALESTVGAAWAIPMDIGADSAGSVAAVMNTCGNIGGALSPLLLAYLVRSWGWETPFTVAAAVSVAAAVLFWNIDASRSIPALHPRPPGGRT